MVLWILIIIILVIGIIFLSKHSPLEKRTRVKSLQDMATFLESKLEPLPGFENSYKVDFNFEGKNFTYEDVQKSSFREEIYKGYLKFKTSTDLTLSFTEKAKQARVEAKTITARQIRETVPEEKEQLIKPEEFDPFDIYTNNIGLANKLLDENKSLRVFTDYKNFDIRGAYFMPLRVYNGTLLLEFDSDQIHKPNVRDLYRDVHSIENHLEQLLTVIKVLEVK